MKGKRGNRYQVRARGTATYRPRGGRMGARTQDLLETKYRVSIAEVAGEGSWTGAADHTPVVCTMGK